MSKLHQDNRNQPVIILSAERDDCTTFMNDRNTRDLERRLQALNRDFKKVLGVFDGQPETAFAVTLPFDTNKKHDIEVMKELAEFYDQECVLYLTPDDGRGRFAYLLYPGVREPEYIGAWKPVSDPAGQDHTREPHTGQCYVVA